MLAAPFPEWYTDRLWLREIVPSDLKNVYKGLSDEMVTQYYAVHFSTLESTQEQMDWYDNLWKTQTGIWWAICEKHSKNFMGTFGYYNYKKADQYAEIGYWLMPDFWGKGYATEALLAILNFGEQTLNLSKIEAFVEAENKASGDLLKKLGFRKDKLMKDSEIKNGRFISVEVYSKITTPGSDALNH